MSWFFYFICIRIYLYTLVIKGSVLVIKLKFDKNETIYLLININLILLNF